MIMANVITADQIDSQPRVGPLAAAPTPATPPTDAEAFDPLSSVPLIKAVNLPSSRPEHASAWHGHIAFAHWLVVATQPRVLVELGTQNGVSYSAFCRAVKTFETPTLCFAVDTWEGDGQTGPYSNETFNNLNAYNEEHYLNFSKMLRCYFDEALPMFADGSVDLLHIDGLHTYEAVKHDFETWLPKMSERGIILFHDVTVRTEGFGVWQLWDELITTHPSFLFLHSAGLGLLLVGSEISPVVQSLCKVRQQSETDRVRQLFEALSEHATETGKAILTAQRQRLVEINPAFDDSNSQDTSHGQTAADAVMLGWAMAEATPWFLCDKIEPDNFWQKLDDLNHSEATVFLLDISQAQTTIVEKPEFARGRNYVLDYDRANCYRMFLDGVVRHFDPNFTTRLAICVNDGALAEPTVPVFGFQKQVGNRTMLLPDPDMLGRNFPVANDSMRYDEKYEIAVFAGSTSGGIGPITSEAILRDGATPRIRMSEYFRNHDDVIIKLPNLVQYDNENTAELLRTMGYGNEENVTWSEQLKNKFIISIDGNGATCTRVSITLTSNSVLLKYDSDSVLYYFSGLTPWVHFVPVSEHKDILTVIDIERRNPGTFRYITTSAQKFAHDFLTLDASRRYTAFLLDLYVSRIAAGRPAKARSNTEPISYVAHVQNHGDVKAVAGNWVGLPGSGCWIEGFTLWTGEDFALEDLTYKSIAPDGTFSASISAGRFSGTAGKHRPIVGLQIQSAGKLREEYRLQYWARFTDGSEAGPFADGEICAQVGQPPLEAFKISISRIS